MSRIDCEVHVDLMPDATCTCQQINVLDHGYVRLVDIMGSDLSISRAARVSYDAPAREKDAGLINYLRKNKHTSPFEAVTLTFEVKAPIFVFRQWHRHRTWSYNEVSARYTTLPSEFYVPEPGQITTQSKDNKQMRSGVPNRYRREIAELIDRLSVEAHDLYHALLNMECPRELARSVLPVNTYSKMFATVNLHNLFHFLNLRMHKHAQYEIMVFARAMLHLIEPHVPQAVAAFKEYG